MTVTVRIENTYEDGHASVHTVIVDSPADPTELEDWWQDEVFLETGDGHGVKHPKLGCFFEATIVAADEPQLVGLTQEWDG